MHRRAFLLTSIGRLAYLWAAMQSAPAPLPMAVAIFACAWAQTLWLSPTSAQPESPSHAAPIWVLLRNGEVMQGRIQGEGQDYKIEMTGGGVAVLPRCDIWRVEPSLRELYDFRRAHAERRGGKAHFELAKWCLAQQYYMEASVHLAIAERADLDAEQLRDLRARIEIAVSSIPRRPPPQSVPVQPVVSTFGRSPTATRESIPTALMSPAAMRQFATRIQPLLLNRCGNATCHGRATPTAFQLTQPHRGGQSTAQITQRNAAAVLRLVNLNAQAAGEFLDLSAKPHGPMTAAALNQRQLASLRQWLATVTGKQGSAESRPPGPDVATAQGLAGLVDPRADEATTIDSRSKRADIRAHDTRVDEALDARGPTDPFDPEVFNRQYHPPGDGR